MTAKLKSLLAAVALLGTAAVSQSASALTLSTTTFCNISQVTTSTACIGAITNPVNPEAGGGDAVADNDLFGITNWTLAQKSDGANNALFNLTLTSGGGTNNGTWSVSGFDGWTEALMVVKAGNTWSAYLLDVVALSGFWNTQGTEPNPRGIHPNLSHLALYVGGDHGNVSAVPLPAALPLLLSGLLGVGLLGRRRRKDAKSA